MSPRRFGSLTYTFGCGDTAAGARAKCGGLAVREMRNYLTFNWILTSAGAAPRADRDAAAQERPARGCYPSSGRRRSDLQRMWDVVGDQFSQVTARGRTMALDRHLPGLRNANSLGAESAVKHPLRD